jgi:hypothetical protein
MLSDIFILNTDSAGCKHLASLHPSAIVIDYPTLTEDAINDILDRSYTKFFYVVDANAPVNNFDFSFQPDEYDAEYTHMWQDSDLVMLYRRRAVEDHPKAFTTHALYKGQIRLKNHDDRIYDSEVRTLRSEPDIFVLAPLANVGDNFADTLPVDRSRVKIIEAFSLNAATMEKILNRCETYYFYVLTTRIKIDSNFDFSFTPDHWDRSYVHVWDTNREMRLFNRPDVESNINLYTDSAWESGKTPLKILDNTAYTLIPYDQLYTSRLNNIFLSSQLPDPKHWAEYILSHCTSPYYYIVKKGTMVNGFDFRFMPTDYWEEGVLHIWHGKPNIIFGSIAHLRECPDILLDIEKHAFNHETNIYNGYGTKWNVHRNLDDVLADENDYSYLLDTDADLLADNLDFQPDIWDTNKVHVWQRVNPITDETYDYSGLYLYPRDYDPDARMQYVRERGCVSKPFDVIFLSYNEPYADDLYQELLQKVPTAKRVHGVRGIFEAHKAAAELAETPMFFVVDADAKLMDTFTFSFMPRKADYHKVYVWRSKNPINELVYGYGGVKLFPTDIIRNTDQYKIDFTTSISKDFIPIAEISNITMIDVDPFTAWKSAFRECVKLASKIIGDQVDKETEERLETWCTVGSDKKHGKDAIAGAVAGKEFGLKYANDTGMLENINNYEWLREQWQNIENNT